MLKKGEGGGLVRRIKGRWVSGTQQRGRIAYIQRTNTRTKRRTMNPHPKERRTTKKAGASRAVW